MLGKALSDAAENGDTAEIRRLLTAGVNVNWRNLECWRWTALHEASANGHCDAMELLIRHGAEVDATAKRNATPLHIASDAGEDEAVAVLLRHGANIDAVDIHGETAFDLADSDEVRAILRAAAGGRSSAGAVDDIDLLIKLGGSAITQKSTLETLDEASLAAIVEMVTALPAGGRIVIVHGAGSFGHFQAKEYGTHLGTEGVAPQRWREGVARTRASVTYLNTLVVRALASAGVPAVGLPAFAAGWETDAAAAAAGPQGACSSTGGVARVRRVLGMGLVPVLHGDVVADAAQGVAVLSGDTIVAELARALRPRACVFLSNTAGVLERPPAVGPRPALLRELLVDGASGAVDCPFAADALAHDTTGGIMGKVNAAAQVARVLSSNASDDGGSDDAGGVVVIARAASPEAAALCAAAFERAPGAVAAVAAAVACTRFRVVPALAPAALAQPAASPRKRRGRRRGAQSPASTSSDISFCAEITADSDGDGGSGLDSSDSDSDGARGGRRPKRVAFAAAAGGGDGGGGGIAIRLAVLLRGGGANDVAAVRKLYKAGMDAEDPDGRFDGHHRHTAACLAGDLSRARIAQYYNVNTGGPPKSGASGAGGAGGADGEPRDAALWVATDARGAVVGMVGCVVFRRRRRRRVGQAGEEELWEDEHGELQRLQVGAAARRRGLGARLVGTVEAYCRARGCARVFLSTITLHAKAMALYARCGFARTPALDRALPWGGVTVVHYEKVLREPPPPPPSRTRALPAPAQGAASPPPPPPPLEARRTLPPSPPASLAPASDAPASDAPALPDGAAALLDVVARLLAPPGPPAHGCPWSAGVDARAMLAWLASETDEISEALDDCDAANADADADAAAAAAAGAARAALCSELGDLLFDALMLCGMVRRDFGPSPGGVTPWAAAAEKIKRRTPYMTRWGPPGVTASTSAEAEVLWQAAKRREKGDEEVVGDAVAVDGGGEEAAVLQEPPPAAAAAAVQWRPESPPRAEIEALRRQQRFCIDADDG